jgi:LacI family transcriptional regulator/LacI family repressor for deo operon, udp, cdd, tsx, nupC, and nupG
VNITIRDVARLAGVSKATVSAVLNNRPGISSTTRQKVLDVVKKLNYRPSQIARSLSVQKTKSIGLVIKEIDNPFFAKIMRGVFDRCSDKGYTVLLGSSELSPDKEIQSVETLINQRVDGLILSPLQGENNDLSYLADLLRSQYPLVVLETVQNYNTNVVDIDNEKAAFDAVCYLIRQGHRRIAMFAGPKYSSHSAARLKGYREALSDHGIPVQNGDILHVGSYIQNGYQAGLQLSRWPSLPSAIFCYNDLVAIGLIDALLEKSIHVPDSVSVLGFDDIDFCDSVKVPLTTVHVPAFEMGKQAADLLIHQISRRDEPLNEKIIVQTHLVERASC